MKVYFIAWRLGTIKDSDDTNELLEHGHMRILIHGWSVSLASIQHSARVLAISGEVKDVCLHAPAHVLQGVYPRGT